MSTKQGGLISFAGRMLAVVVLTTAGSALLQAQTTPDASTVPAAAIESAVAQAPRLDLRAPAADLTSEATSSSSSSSDTSPDAPEVAVNTAVPFNFMNAMQYGGGRKRYGRPRYRGGNTNADGSSKYDFYVGGGFGIPVSTQSNYLTTSWGMQVGGGRNFNKVFGLNLEFDYDHFGMTNTTINNQSEFYFDDTAADTGLDGNSHVISLSLQPIVNLRSGEGLGAYITGGVGFYHKVANFTIPQEEDYCDPYYGCEAFEAPENIDHYTSNAAGFDGGFGVTYKFSKFANERLYAEVRYVYVANQAKAGAVENEDGTFTSTNFFPQNSQRTSYMPVKIGLRF